VVIVNTSQENPCPRVSLVIVNLNGLSHLKHCLPSIFQQTYPFAEVIVVDNASTDGSPEFVEINYPLVSVLRNEQNLGYAGANNVGFQQATGELIAVLNPDTRVDPNWMTELVGAMADPEVGLATPKILLMDEPDQINTCGNEITYTGLTFCRGLDETKDHYNQREFVSAVSGAAFLIRRSALDLIGGFDERYFIYYEETDLSLRAALAGYKCIYVPSSIVYHKYHFKFSPEKAFYQERNRYFSLIKTLRWRTLLVLFPSLLIAELVGWGYSLINGPQHVLSKIRAYIWLLRNLAHILEARRQVQALRRVEDKAILKYFGYRLNFTWTVKPSLAKILDRSVNPILYLFARIAQRVVTW